MGQLNKPSVYTPDDLAAGRLPDGPVLVYDFDNYYMGGLVAEYLADRGLKVSYATPAGHASAWTFMTNEQPFVHRALHERNVDVSTQTLLKDFDGNSARLENIFTAAASAMEVRSVVIVGHRQPCDEVYQDLDGTEKMSLPMPASSRSNASVTHWPPAPSCTPCIPVTSTHNSSITSADRAICAISRLPNTRREMFTRGW